jgi:exodeoxyribonuclease V alpha subunit
VAAAMAARSAFCVISGGPGTGKTTTVVQLIALLQGAALQEGRKLRIRIAAPTGKAAARLTESIGTAVGTLPENVRAAMPGEVSTLHRLLGSRPGTRHFRHDRRNPLHADLVVVDEASMIDMEMMAALLEALPLTARLILLGDKDQLASVEAGSVLGDLCRNAERPTYRPETVDWIEAHTGYRPDACRGNGSDLDQRIVVLRKSHRFGERSGIGALARAVNAGDSQGVEDIWRKGYTDLARLSAATTADARFTSLVLDGVCASTAADRQDAQGPAGYRAYLTQVGAGPQGTDEDTWLHAVLGAFSRFQVLTPIRQGPWGVEGLNARIAEILNRAGLIPSCDGWYPGRPVLVSRNDYNLGLMNGDTGIVLPVRTSEAPQGEMLRAVFPMADGTLKKVMVSRLSAVETVYAMTVHKSQGSEFQHTALVLPDTVNPVLTRELVYTGITRARRWFTLVSPSEAILAHCVKRRTHRASGLADGLAAE